MTNKEVMQQALEALERADKDDFWREQRDAITALRTALEQQAEPVALKCGAIIEVFDKDWRMEYLSLPVGKHKLYTQQYIYTAPPQRQWVGLTDEEVNRESAPIAQQMKLAFHAGMYVAQKILKEKNSD